MKKWYLAILLAAAVGTAQAAEEGAFLQMGVYSNPDLADRQAAAMALRGIVTKVETHKEADGRTIYRVRSERMPHRQAEENAARLRKDNIEVLIFQARAARNVPAIASAASLGR